MCTSVILYTVWYYYTALEETKHCLQPKKVHMVYWPVKQLYEVNDSITILNCGDGLVHAGSHEMRCTQDGTWEGDFECLSRKNPFVYAILMYAEYLLFRF